MSGRNCKPGPVLTITPNPCVDKTLFIDVPLRVGQKIRGTKWTCVAGGKGCNVSRAVQALGGPTCALIVAGGLTGDHVRQMLEEDDGVPCVMIRVADWTRTITTVLETGKHRQTALFEPGPRVTPEEARQAVDIARREIARAGVVTLNGSTPSPTLDDLYAEAVRAAVARGLPVILDAYGEVFRRALPERPLMIKPNREEAETFLGYPLKSADDYARAAETFHRFGVQFVVISDGRKGAFCSDGSQRFRAKPPKIREVNPVGSGDVMVAAMALYLGGYPLPPGIACSDTPRTDLETLARFGAAAGAANAMTWDIGHFDPEQIVRLAEMVEIRPC